MKPAVWIIVLAGLVIPAYGFDDPGLRQIIQVDTGGYEFAVDTTSNFDIIRHEFDADKKQLTLFVDSRVENNLTEFSIPTDLIGGNFTFYLNGQEIFPKVLSSEKVTFVVAEFAGSGLHKIEIIGTTYLPEFGIAVLVLAFSIAAITILGLRGPGIFSLKQ